MEIHRKSNAQKQVRQSNEKTYKKIRPLKEQEYRKNLKNNLKNSKDNEKEREKNRKYIMNQLR